MDTQFLFDKLLKSKTDNTLIQLFRYTFVGGFAYVIDFGSLFVFTEFVGVHYLVSAALAFLLGLITNYVLSVLWVFSTRTVRNKWVEFAIFSSVGIGGLALNEILIWFFTEHAHFHYLLSKVFSSFFVYFWNFFARKYALFR